MRLTEYVEVKRGSQGNFFLSHGVVSQSGTFSRIDVADTIDGIWSRRWSLRCWFLSWKSDHEIFRRRCRAAVSTIRWLLGTLDPSHCLGYIDVHPRALLRNLPRVPKVSVAIVRWESVRDRAVLVLSSVLQDTDLTGVSSSTTARWSVIYF